LSPQGGKRRHAVQRFVCGTVKSPIDPVIRRIDSVILIEVSAGGFPQKT
jgi:hypothetical protein